GRHDLLGAAQLVARLGGPASEDLLAARCGAPPRRVERADDVEPGQRRPRHADLRSVPMEPCLGLGVRPLGEGDTDLPWPRLDRYADVLEALAKLPLRDGLELIDRLQLVRAAERLAKHDLAVDRHDQIVTVLEAAPRPEPQVELVLAVGRE